MRKEKSTVMMEGYLKACGLERIFPNEVLPKLELLLFEPGEFINQSGEQANYFCICLSGKMKVIPSSEGGKIVLLDYIKPLDFLGDIELFCQCENLHSVTALTPCVVLAIPKSVFEREMMENVAFLRFVCERLAGKLHQSSKNYSRSMLYPVKSRFCYYLLQLSEEAEADIFPVKMIEAAQYLGITDRHLRRILGELEAEGMLVQHASIITILDKKKVEEAASYL